jgi:mannose-6-phosphate isomerase
MYPLKFHPFLKQYPYGGRRFAEVFEKDGVPRGVDIAESWEISDHGAEQSTVANGPLAGRTLNSLVQEFGAQLVGEEMTARYGSYFPLLIKFLDCDKRLPAHLHPSDEDARRLGLPDPGKVEAWYIVRADPGASAHVGAKLGLAPHDFEAAIRNGDAYDGVMNHVMTTTGDTYFVPAGRPHGLGAGNLAFEVQQNSDSGFGWDWAGFVEAGVVPAEDAQKHKALAVEVALYETGVQESTMPVTIEEGPLKRTFCAACKYFVLENLRSLEPVRFVDAASRFNTLSVINGAATIRGGGEEVFVRRGDSLLIPAGVEIEILPQSGTNAGEVEILRCYVPDLQRDVVQVLADRDVAPRAIAGLGSYGVGNDLLPLLGLPSSTFLLTEEARERAIAAASDSRDETS